MNILVTGVLGFIFSNFMHRVVRDRPQDTWIGLDKAVYKYNLANRLPGSVVYLADIADAHTLDNIFTLERPEIVIGGAAESFVDDAIGDVLPFIRTNVIGTQCLVNMCLKYRARYVHISTDEVYGQQPTAESQAWSEESPLAPRNPYAASKACAELVVRASHVTHGLEYQMVRMSNVYGPRQKRFNLVPHIIDSLLHGKPIQIHGNGQNFRQYIYVDDAIDGILTVLDKGALNDVYNIGGNDFFTNIEMVWNVAREMGKEPQVRYIADRKAHDFGYRVDSAKLRALGWQPSTDFAVGLHRTVSHYVRGAVRAAA